MLPRLRPRNFYDLVIEVAIVRPGPIQGGMVHPYLRRRSGEEPVSYPSDEVEAVLEAHARRADLPGAGDAARDRRGRLHAGRGRPAAPRHGRVEAQGRPRAVPAAAHRRHARARLREAFAEQIYQQILGFGEYGFPECVVGETRVVDADTGEWTTLDELVSGRVSLLHTFACDARQRLVKRRVIRVMRSGIKPVLRLSAGPGLEVTASAEHPFLTPVGWACLGELQTGDRVAITRGQPAAGAAIGWARIEAIEPLGARETFDLTVEGDHNFVANQFVVHNSHSASFGLLVYISSWLKRYEPAAFCAALINSQPMGFYAPPQLVRDARAHGVEVRPVDLTVSDWDCSLERGADGAGSASRAAHGQAPIGGGRAAPAGGAPPAALRQCRGSRRTRRARPARPGGPGSGRMRSRPSPATVTAPSGR